MKMQPGPWAPGGLRRAWLCVVTAAPRPGVWVHSANEPSPGLVTAPASVTRCEVDPAPPQEKSMESFLHRLPRGGVSPWGTSRTFEMQESEKLNYRAHHAVIRQRSVKASWKPEGAGLTTGVPVLDLGTWGHHRDAPPSLPEPGSAQGRP